MGTPTDPRRAHKDRRNSRAVRRDRGSRFPARGRHAAEAHIRAGVHRTWHPPDAHRRGHRNPTGEWTVQQARNLALGLGERFEDIKFLVRDRGSNFTASFDAIFQAAGTRILRTAVQAPRMNAICERLVGTLRRELLDRMLILGEAHLRTVLAEYQVHYNTARPHQGIAQCVRERRTRRWPLRRCRPRPRTDPPKTRPWRPDQRILARCLTPQRLAGHQPDPIFRAGQDGHLHSAATRRAPSGHPVLKGALIVLRPLSGGIPQPAALG